MPSERIDAAVIRWQKASARFDYYLTGLTVAVLALSVETYSPSGGPWWLVVSAWVLLALSILAGLSRVEKWKQHLKVEANRLEAEAEVSRSRPGAEDKLSKIWDKSEQVKEYAYWAYLVRWWTFALGFGALVLAKIVAVVPWW